MFVVSTACLLIVFFGDKTQTQAPTFKSMRLINPSVRLFSLHRTYFGIVASDD